MVLSLSHQASSHTGKNTYVGKAFITSAFRVNTLSVYPERGRDECFPYIGFDRIF
jgi:hypothetical protein